MSRTFSTVLAVLGALVPVFGTPTFQTGDLFWSSSTNVKIYDVLTGGDLRSATPFATIGASGNYGQIAFSADLTTAYVTVWSANKVVAVSATGQVTDFATGIAGPTGIIRTSSGKLLVADNTNGRIYDITAGGNFASATAYATGLNGPRNFVETPNGVYVANQNANTIIKIGSGGNLSAVTPFATNILRPADLEFFNNKIYATMDARQVYDITSGGNIMGTRSAWATGRYFYGLAASGGKLYASTDAGDLSGPTIYDITAGGNMASKSSYARMPGIGDSILDAVPVGQQQQAPPSETPEVASVILVGCGLAMGSRILRLRTAAV